ncbi:hypothetical protein OKW26_002554 [Paraburkholderia sp. 32]
MKVLAGLLSCTPGIGAFPLVQVSPYAGHGGRSEAQPQEGDRVTKPDVERESRDDEQRPYGRRCPAERASTKSRSFSEQGEMARLMPERAGASSRGENSADTVVCPEQRVCSGRFKSLSRPDEGVPHPTAEGNTWLAEGGPFASNSWYLRRSGVPVATACRLDGQKRHDRSDPRPWRGMIRVSAQPGYITYVHGLSARGT